MINVTPEDRIIDLCAAFRTYGYFVASSPIPGQEELYIKTLTDDLGRLLADVDYLRNANRYGRGQKGRMTMLTHLHLHHCPGWGIELAKG